MSSTPLSLNEKPVPDSQSPTRDGTSPQAKDESRMPPLEDIHAEFRPGISFMLAFFSICIITLAAALDATSLSIALPIITEKLKGSAIEAFWSGTSFLVTSAVFQPVIAGLSHVFGRKQVCLSMYLYSEFRY
jgi:hypothetical protein